MADTREYFDEHVHMAITTVHKYVLHITSFLKFRTSNKTNNNKKRNYTGVNVVLSNNVSNRSLNSVKSNIKTMSFNSSKFIHDNVIHINLVPDIAHLSFTLSFVNCEIPTPLLRVQRILMTHSVRSVGIFS